MLIIADGKQGVKPNITSAKGVDRAPLIAYNESGTGKGYPYEAAGCFVIDGAFLPSRRLCPHRRACRADVADDSRDRDNNDDADNDRRGGSFR